MSRAFEIQEGMQVSSGDQLIGRVERLHGDRFHINGQHYTRDMVTGVEHNRIHLGDTGSRGTVGFAGRADAETMGTTRTRAAGEGEARVPVAEERLNVGKREVDPGEVAVRKTVTVEKQTVPVTLRRDEVRVEEVNVADRPLRQDEDAFNEDTIRVQVRGEEPVVSKEAVVTGEVVVDKETIAREQQVSGTIRKEHVDADKAYEGARTDFERAHATTAGATGHTFEQAEPHYRAGFTAAHDERYVGREFEDVEPTLRSEYETDVRTCTGGARGSGGDRWEQLREEVREGWNRARNR